MAAMKLEPAQFAIDMTYGDWEQVFCNDLVILGKANVWLETNKPG